MLTYIDVKNLSALFISKKFYFLICLNLISNLSYYANDNSLWAIFCMLSLAVLFATAETCIIKLLDNVKKWIGKTLYILFCVIHSCIVALDYFLLLNFHRVFNQDIIDILAETNETEVSNFIQTYISPLMLILGVVAIVALNVALFFISKNIVITIKLKVQYIWIGLLVSSLFVVGRMGYSYVVYGEGLSVPQYMAPIRVSYSFVVLKKRAKEIKQLTEICEIPKTSCYLIEKPHVIIAIGESYSKYHSSLYDYTKITNPLLSIRKSKNEVVLFSNAVAIADGTNRNMRAMFSLAKDGSLFASSLLFPACFKGSGYETMLLDNQYLLGKGTTFLTDENLSKVLWDKRNSEGFQYDGQMIDGLLTPFEDSGLYVVHLYGQHYTYENRYPNSFAHFKADEYDIKRWSKEQREIIAHYDNACLYNDYVVNDIINKFENENAIVVYLSDHGEEIYELSNYMGHGTACSSDDCRYQLDVPFLIWMSKKYRETYPDMVTKIEDCKDLPISTDDLPHALMDIAGIETKDYVPELSFLNPKYNAKRHRIIMAGFDYDEHVSKMKR